MNRPLFINWNSRNETGIALIDEQHRGIVSIINTFYCMIATDADNRILYSCISDTMKNYSRIHFITEEGFLEESGYKEIEKHKELHRKLVLEMERIELHSIMSNDAFLLLEFLKKWWMTHINEEDMLYARHLHDYVLNTQKQ
jgi:hemerythrin-like metal-binding protein